MSDGSTKNVDELDNDDHSSSKNSDSNSLKFLKSKATKERKSKSIIKSTCTDWDSILKHVRQMVMVDNINKINCVEKQLNTFKYTISKNKTKPKVKCLQTKSVSIFEDRPDNGQYLRLPSLDIENSKPLQKSSSSSSSRGSKKGNNYKKKSRLSKKVSDRRHMRYLNQFRNVATTKTACSPFKATITKKLAFCVKDSPIDLISLRKSIIPHCNNGIRFQTETSELENPISHYNSYKIVPYEELEKEIAQMQDEVFNYGYKSKSINSRLKSNTTTQ